MDKRYFIIIIIIFVCCINLYLVSNVSDVIGSAYVDTGNYTLTIPNGFSLQEDKSNQVMIYNPNSNMYITIISSLVKNDNFLNKYEEINNDTDYKILSNGTINFNGIEIDSMFYQNVKNLDNRSTFYFTRYDNNFRILITGFDYNTQKDEVINLTCAMIESIRFNYKI